MNTTLSILLMAIGSILCAFIKKGSTAVIVLNLSYKGYVWAKW